MTSKSKNQSDWVQKQVKDNEGYVDWQQEDIETENKKRIVSKEYLLYRPQYQSRSVFG